jgi:16S rRNA (cytosine967-C5)-methyltransferase
VTQAPARRLALRTLARVRRDDAFAGPVLAAELSRASLSPADAGLATRLVHGVLTTAGVLDDAIARYARRPPEPRVADILRLAAFELLYSRTPPYAVIDQAVSAVRAIRPQAAGMANAVLRRLSEDAPEFPWGDPASDPDAFARQCAHPRWIVDRVLHDLGESAGREALLSGVEPAPSFIRLDPFTGDRDATLQVLSDSGLEAAPPDPDCFRVRHPASLYGGLGSTRGWFAMDAAAQMAPSLLAPQPGEAVLDIGAGRGNKTICLQAIALRAGGSARITAIDIHERKSAALCNRLADSAGPNVEVITGDALDLDRTLAPASFDAVLLDAPCTGLGTLRRYPEKRWRIDPGDIDRMGELQDRLIEVAGRMVRPGGRLVYSTCSLATRENGGVVHRFLESAGAAFVLEPVGSAVPAEWQGFVDESGCFQSWPVIGGPDGHYVAVLRREKA